MGSEEGEGDYPEPSILDQFCVLVEDGSADLNYTVGSFRLNAGTPLIPIVLICKISDQFLVSVPFEAWHRLKAQRLFPSDGLQKPVLVEVAAVRDLDREVLESDNKVKVWVGYLKRSLEACLSFDLAEPEFACSFVTESGVDGCVPYAESLVSLADEKFSFLSAL